MTIRCPIPYFSVQKCAHERPLCCHYAPSIRTSAEPALGLLPDSQSAITSWKCGLRGRPQGFRVPFGTGPFFPTCLSTYVFAYLWWHDMSSARSRTLCRQSENKDNFRCLITILSIGIARRRLYELIFVKTSNSTKTDIFHFFCL